MIPSVISQLRILQKQYVTVNNPRVDACRPGIKVTLMKGTILTLL